MKRAPREAPNSFQPRRTAGSPIIAVPAMPVVPAADTARTVIGPDDSAVVRIIVVGIVAAVEEMPAVEMREAIAAEVMEATVAEAAAVPATSMPAATTPATTTTMEGVEASTVEATAVETAPMETTAVEAASAMETAAAMAAAANLYQPIACNVGG